MSKTIHHGRIDPEKAQKIVAKMLNDENPLIRQGFDSYGDPRFVCRYCKGGELLPCVYELAKDSVVPTLLIEGENHE